MNVLDYTAKKFFMLERFERLANTLPDNKKVITKIDDEKQRLQEIIMLCSSALTKHLDVDIGEVTPEILDKYNFTLTITKKNNDSVILGGDLC